MPKDNFAIPTLDELFMAKTSDLILNEDRLIRFLRINDHLKLSYKLTPVEKSQVKKIYDTKRSNTINLLREFIFNEQTHFLEDGTVDTCIRQYFSGMHITDTDAIRTEIAKLRLRQYVPETYNEERCFNLFWARATLAKKQHYACIVGTLAELIRGGSNSFILDDFSLNFNYLLTPGQGVSFVKI